VPWELTDRILILHLDKRQLFGKPFQRRWHWCWIKTVVRFCRGLLIVQKVWENEKQSYNVIWQKSPFGTALERLNNYLLNEHMETFIYIIVLSLSYSL
jgi:hypothetical protein